jgi:hypothetical protein
MSEPTIMVKLYDRYDRDIYINIPCKRVKKKKVEARKPLLERIVLWWAAIKAQEAV